MRLQNSLGNRGVGQMVQTRLIVGPSGDRYEEEAERVAEQVMGMHHEAAHPSEGAGAQVQRACKACGHTPTEDDAKIRRKCAECEKEEEAKARMSPQQAVKSASETGPTHRGMLNEHDLRSGGDPLPDPIRHFFEARFSRDFRDVRVHTGTISEHYNDSLHSYGFTYGNHIWLGRGQEVAPSLLMAHELAHVVQQHRPARIHGGRGFGQALHPDREPVVRRFEPYWEPYNQKDDPKKLHGGDENHAMILPAMGKANKGLFTEVPVPNAKTSTGNEGELSDIVDVKGQVDLYKGSTTVGAYFKGHGKPVTLSSIGLKEILKEGVHFDHNANSAPQVVNGALVNSASAPTKIEIGELKPNSFLGPFQGSLQLTGYQSGFEKAHQEAVSKDTPGDGAAWTSLSVSRLSGLTLPPEYTHPTFSGQTPQPVVIKQFGRKPVKPKTPVNANLAVWPSAHYSGVWVYAWVPTSTITAAKLPAGIAKLGPEITTKVVDPLLETPPAPAKKSKPGPAPAPPPVITTEPKPVVRRKEASAPEKDTFDYEKWKADRKELTTQTQTEESSAEFKDAEEGILANRAQEKLRHSGLNVPEIPGGKEAGQTVSKIEFWTGLGGGVFGLLRKVFGRAFVAVAQFFIKMRDKVRDILKKMKSTSSPGSGFLGAALKASFKVLKMIARFVIGKVADRLLQSLLTGVANKVKSWIGPEYMEELEAKKEEMEKLRAEIEQKISDTADQLLEKLFGVHIKDIEKLRETYGFIVDFIVPLISLVRWGVRVIECLSPPAFGCLWILAEAAADFLLQKLAETCWFQKKIQPIIAKVKYVTTDIPNMLGDGIISKLKGILPKSLGDMFADLETGEVKPTADETGCDDEDDHTDYHEDPLHDEIEELYKRIGPERAAAMGELAKKMTQAKDRPLTAADLKRLGDELMKVSPEQLQKYADQFPGGGDGVPVEFSKLVDEINQAPPPGAATGGTTTPTPAPPPPPPPDESSNANKDAGGSSKPPEKKDDQASESEGGGLATVDASSRITDAPVGETRQDVKGQVMNPNSKLHTKGTEPDLDVLVWWKNDPKVLVRNVQTVVTRRPLFPTTAKTLDDALALDIKYKVKHTYKIDEVPGALIGKDQELTGRIFTSLGQKYLEERRKQHAKEAAKK